MKSSVLTASRQSYPQLVKAIKNEIASGRQIIQQTQAQMYWKVGKYISGYILQGKDRAQYGVHLYERLAKDLDVSVDVLQRAVRFSKEFPISAARQKLTWTHYRSLLTLPNPADRRALIQKALNRNLTSRELQKEITVRKPFAIDPNAPIPQLKSERGELYTYAIIEPPSLQPVEGYKFVDCGFDVWRQIPTQSLTKFDNGTIVESVKTDETYKIKSTDRAVKDLYTFKVTVERIIDADTLVAHIDLGFNTWTKQKLRLRGIDCAEILTAAGQRAKRFIESKIKPNDFVIIKTHKDDKYGRYLVDVWYFSRHTKDDILNTVFLNQELLNERLAVKF
ncbi:MAG: hypothetical protein A2787_07580 [Omnitrophica WOR_2 bacterium RIFCSPHIGHO2_01_FULL_48_9]|nr:MAG: hypothetical protein A3D10_02835 [Omnitrophica WOR_2 bacterium RIFCSPHIGHO2_02_FULL_48_11]OGX32680.1 MAG: hypothetical protein A2787_07580 [Omnitrophica WOR_2 bacterium RIFCSPHIGHO2_01_FULL_48_9]